VTKNFSDGFERATLSASWDTAPASKGSRMEDQLSIEAREGKSPGQVTREEGGEKDQFSVLRKLVNTRPQLGKLRHE
jgi:hypothetical protein